MDADADITQLLQDWRAGDRAALDALLPVVYDELRAMARQHLRRERVDHSFKSNDLVHEVYFKLVQQERVDWKSRAHFYALAATFIRRILVDHAKKRLAEKRRPQLHKITLNEEITPDVNDVDLTYLVDVDAAIARLAGAHPRQARVVELKFFVELSIDEIAEVLEVGSATIKRDWNQAKTFLARELSAPTAAATQASPLDRPGHE